MPATYYIKVYFNKPGQEQPEIRRFPVSLLFSFIVRMGIYTFFTF